MKISHPLCFLFWMRSLTRKQNNKINHNSANIHIYYRGPNRQEPSSLKRYVQWIWIMLAIRSSAAVVLLSFLTDCLVVGPYGLQLLIRSNIKGLPLLAPYVCYENHAGGLLDDTAGTLDDARNDGAQLRHKGRLEPVRSDSWRATDRLRKIEVRINPTSRIH